MFEGKPFPVRCPRCHQIEGWPVEARTVSTDVHVDFRCRACDGEWAATISALATRKTDRLPFVERRRVWRAPIDSHLARRS